MCFISFIVKYVLFFANFIFSLAGLTLIGLGIAVLVNLSDVFELVPVNLAAIPIAVIVFGSIVFMIAFFGCCGAIRESQCLLIMYMICMGLLAAGKIYLVVVIFNALEDIQGTVSRWIDDAFANENMRIPFNVMEVAFRCCGPNGPASYVGSLPTSCCPSTGDEFVATCAAQDAFSAGCSGVVADYIDVFGEALGYVMSCIIAIELVALVFGFILTCSIGNKLR